MTDKIKIRVVRKEIPIFTAEMKEELKRRARDPNLKRRFPEFPEWRSYEISDDQMIQEHNIIPLFDEGGRPGDPPGPKPFDEEYDDLKGSNRATEEARPELAGRN